MPLVLLIAAALVVLLLILGVLVLLVRAGAESRTLDDPPPAERQRLFERLADLLRGAAEGEELVELWAAETRGLLEVTPARVRRLLAGSRVDADEFRSLYWAALRVLRRRGVEFADVRTRLAGRDLALEGYRRGVADEVEVGDEVCLAGIEPVRVRRVERAGSRVRLELANDRRLDLDVFTTIQRRPRETGT